MRFIPEEPRGVGSDLCKQCSTHPSASVPSQAPKTRLCLRERKHDPTFPSAQGKVWLYRRMFSLRTSSARWQFLLLGLGRRSLADPGGAHLSSAGLDDPSEHE